MGNIASNDAIKLGEKIGEGSYGEVYRGVWRGRPVAAKRIRSFFFDNDYYCLQNQGKIFNNLKREWEIMSGLKHPNIVEYLTVIMTQGVTQLQPVIVTELCATDLYKFIRVKSNRKVPFPDAVSIMLDVAQGLDYLHNLDEPIIHRDISSRNILITENKTAKIADLGLAKAFPNGAMYATAGVGCQIYAAPETYPDKLGIGKYSQKTYYTEKADIFSFGAVLLEVIIGRLPEYLPGPIMEDGEIIPEYIRRSQDLHEMGTEHPLGDLVNRCLDNSPDKRPEAKGLVDFLGHFKVPEEVHESCSNIPRQLFGKTSPISTSQISITRMPLTIYDYAFKVVMLGVPGVGKTSIIQRFLHPNLETSSSISTLQPGDYFERLQIRGKSVHVHIVDTPGEIKSVFHNATSAMSMIYRGVNGVALVFNVGCPLSFKELPVWLEIVRYRCTPETPIVLIGNQTDKPPNEWKVTSLEAQAWASKNDLFYIETSATGLINIDVIFTVLIEKMIQQKHENEPSTSKYGVNSKDSWLSCTPSRSLLKNASPYYLGIPEITEKNPAKALPPGAGSFRVEADTSQQNTNKKKNCWC